VCVGHTGELIPAKTDEAVVFIGARGVGTRVLDPCFRWGARWQHLANTIERSVRGGYAALCPITLVTISSQHAKHSATEQPAAIVLVT